MINDITSQRKRTKVVIIASSEYRSTAEESVAPSAHRIAMNNKYVAFGSGMAGRSGYIRRAVDKLCLHRDDLMQKRSSDRFFDGRIA